MLDWVDWYNHKRLLGSIGHIPPAEAEAAAICDEPHADGSATRTNESS